MTSTNIEIRYQNKARTFKTVEELSYWCDGIWLALNDMREEHEKPDEDIIENAYRDTSAVEGKIVVVSQDEFEKIKNGNNKSISVGYALNLNDKEKE